MCKTSENPTITNVHEKRRVPKIHSLSPQRSKEASEPKSFEYNQTLSQDESQLQGEFQGATKHSALDYPIGTPMRDSKAQSPVELSLMRGEQVHVKGGWELEEWMASLAMKSKEQNTQVKELNDEE